MKQTPTEEGARVITPEEVLTRIEGEYFFDYAAFSGTLREYIVRALEANYNKEPNDLHRRAFTLAVYREEYTAYEDAGAVLNAFLKSDDSSTPPLLRIVNYAPGQVRLDRLLERHNIQSGDDLFKALNLETWVPESWSAHYKEIDLVKVLRRACYFFVEDSRPGQRQTGVSAFNKIKHGLVLVPEGREYAPQLPSAPAILFATDSKDPSAEKNPVTVMAIPTDPDKVEGRLRMIHFTQFNLRILAILYVLKQHPGVLKGRGLPADARVLGTGRLLDVLKFMRESSAAEWSK